MSLFNCIEEIKLEIDKDKMPKSEKLVIPVNLQLISLWTIDDFSKENSSDIKIELIDPTGKVLNEFLNTLKSKKKEKRLRSITNIQGIQITEGGRYYYRISQKKGNKFETVSETPLDINLLYKKIKN
ncbi:MAG: hypothetical protein PF488_04470 [Patescibacteria group bacterium]|nr:hypothetical protein [Patescibacteria group bacterium]